MKRTDMYNIHTYLFIEVGRTRKYSGQYLEQPDWGIKPMLQKITVLQEGVEQCSQNSLRRSGVRINALAMLAFTGVR